jgi:hypothetical protein
MKETVSQSLYSYWNELRGDRLAPKRFEIEPSCIAGNLPDTFILERVTPSTLRFRIAGTRICEAFGIDFRGLNLLQFFEGEDVRTLQQQIALSVSSGAVTVFQFEASSTTGHSAKFELLLMPLTHTRNSVDRFLGSISPINKPSWLGTVALTHRTLLSHETVWPDGSPHTKFIQTLPHQAQLLPVVREARIVRSQRRHFRVYEGGLARSNNN